MFVVQVCSEMDITVSPNSSNSSTWTQWVCVIMDYYKQSNPALHVSTELK